MKHLDDIVIHQKRQCTWCISWIARYAVFRDNMTYIEGIEHIKRMEKKKSKLLHINLNTIAKMRVYIAFIEDYDLRLW
jgi:hypothetical protein